MNSPSAARLLSAFTCQHRYKGRRLCPAHEVTDQPKRAPPIFTSNVSNVDQACLTHPPRHLSGSTDAYYLGRSLSVAVHPMANLIVPRPRRACRPVERPLTPARLVRVVVLGAGDPITRKLPPVRYPSVVCLARRGDPDSAPAPVVRRVTDYRYPEAATPP